MEAMRASAGVKNVERENAETELFATMSRPSVATGNEANSLDSLAGLRGTRTRLEHSALADYEPRELEQGEVLSIAVLLRDQDKLSESVRAIERATRRAGLSLKVASWQDAAGYLGQFATLMRAVLFVAELIIFIVALVVINNALIMATLERSREFGTLRAVGAQRRFILAVQVFESLVIGLAAGAFGAAVGGLVLARLRETGIPASDDAMAFVFSGSRLFPTVNATGLLFALATVLLVSVASGLYPAWLAMRVSPREAMQAED
jgi:ABC-type lipoprotein release transport system permease subunit